MENRNVTINKPPVLFDETQTIIAEIERKLNCTLISYWNSPNGAVCQNDVIVLYEILKSIGKQDKIAFFIKSEGGNGQAALRIVHMLRQFAHDVTALIPLDCVSAATMMALGANEIQMGPLACLSAVDTSLTHMLSPVDKNNNSVSVSQNELMRIINLWEKNSSGHDTNPYKTIFEYIHPLVIGAVDRASSLSIRLCTEILSYHMQNKEKAEQISQRLNSDYPSHSYPITILEAKRIGLNVVDLDPEINDLLIALNKVYSEMGQPALTDYDEANYHDNEILNIIETNGIQVHFQVDKDWHYRMEERRWIPMNDKSSWRKVQRLGDEVVEGVFYIR